LVLLFLDTGIKSNELFLLAKAHVDISDPYNPELWIKHSGKQTKKDRKVRHYPKQLRHDITLQADHAVSF
jgi:hypothetical protein